MTIADLANRLATKTLESGIRQCELGVDDCGLADLLDALQIEQETVVPFPNIHTAKIYYWIACSYSKQYHFEEAIRHFYQALHVQEELVGRNHEDTMKTYHSLGVVYMKRPQYYRQQQQRQQQGRSHFTFDDANIHIHHHSQSSQRTTPTSHTTAGSAASSPASLQSMASPKHGQAYGVTQCKEDPFHALIHLRTSTRIQMWKYGTYNTVLQPNSRQLLYQLLDNSSAEDAAPPQQHSHADPTALRRIQTDLLEHHRAMSESIQYEKSGDIYRYQGQYKLAISEYEKCCKLEEFAFGTTNPTLCFLKRKLGILYSIKSIAGGSGSSGGATIIDWNNDTLDLSKWVDSCQDYLEFSKTATDLLVLGDEYYRKQQFEDSIKFYMKAIQIGRSKRKSSSSSGKKSTGKSSSSSTRR